nr:retrotransposon protein, putative, Ty1-copia subclass [Tanacetum cinerariifolium]
VKCIFIGYPKETMGYYFYFLPENKIVVTRYAEFFEGNLISQEVSVTAIDLKEIQDEDTPHSEISSKIPMDVEGFEPPQEEVISIRMSERTHRAPNRLCLNVEVEEHSLGDLNEPTSYKAKMLDSESNKWIDVMNAEIKSMMDNMVWVLVYLPPGYKNVGRSCTKSSDEMISCTSRDKPLVLPWGRTSRLDSDVRGAKRYFSLDDPLRLKKYFSDDHLRVFAATQCFALELVGQSRLVSIKDFKQYAKTIIS